MSIWPESGDSLLALGIDWRAEALLTDDPDWIVSYALSFKHAAEIVVSSVNFGSVPPDSVSYPILCLYKHYLELMLKGLICIGRGLLREGVDFPKTHSLKQLWNIFRPLIEDVCPEGDRAEINAVERCIFEMDAIGEGCRYGRDKKGLPTLPEKLQISLSNVFQVMRRIAGFLEGSYDWMDELLQYQADMDAEAL